MFLKFSAFIKNPNPAFNESTPVSPPAASPGPPHLSSLCVSGLWKTFHSTLEKLNTYLETPLPCELDESPDASRSSRRFLDGDRLTLADCNLLPKLHVVKVPERQVAPPSAVCSNLSCEPRGLQVVCQEYCAYDISDCGLQALTRYLENASTQDEFRYTCPPDSEILFAYKSVAKYRKTEEECGRKGLKNAANCR